MIDIDIKAFADEGEVVLAVQNELNITYEEAENLYIARGGYKGYSVNFSTIYPKEDAFSVAVQELMKAKGIDSLDVGYYD